VLRLHSLLDDDPHPGFVATVPAIFLPPEKPKRCRPCGQAPTGSGEPSSGVGGQRGFTRRRHFESDRGLPRWFFVGPTSRFGGLPTRKATRDDDELEPAEPETAITYTWVLIGSSRSSSFSTSSWIKVLTAVKPIEDHAGASSVDRADGSGANSGR